MFWGTQSHTVEFASCSYTFGKQVSFDVIATSLYIVYSKWMEVVNKFLVSVSAAFCASLVACIFSQPGDMILTETYKDHEPGSFGKVLRTLYERGGLAEFFRGTGARIVHVGMIITSQLVIYDIVKQLLGLPATGAH
jgi:solute carrier family 25 phosphate transporter 3